MKKAISLLYPTLIVYLTMCKVPYNQLRIIEIGYNPLPGRLAWGVPRINGGRNEVKQVMALINPSDSARGAQAGQKSGCRWRRRL